MLPDAAGGSRGAEQGQRAPAQPTGPGGDRSKSDPAGAAGPAVAQQPAAHAAGSAGPASDTAGAADSTVTDQPGTAAGPSPLTHRTRPARTAVAPQNPAGPTGLPGAGHCVNPVADQWTPQQEVRGRIDRTEDVFSEGLQRVDIGRLRGRICPAGGTQSLHKLLMKRRRLRAERLVFLGVAGKQRGNRRRYFVSSSSHQRAGRRQCGQVRGPHRGGDTRHIYGCCRQHVRCGDEIRHCGLQPGNVLTIGRCGAAHNCTIPALFRVLFRGGWRGTVAEVLAGLAPAVPDRVGLCRRNIQ